MKQSFYSNIAKSVRSLLCIAAVVSGASLSASSLAAQTPSSPPLLDTARVIVKFKTNASLLQKQAQNSKTNETIFEAKARSNAEQLGNRLGMRLTAGRLLTERIQVLQADGMSSEQLVQRLSKEADIEYVVVDHLRKTNAAPNDPLFAAGPTISGQTGGPASGQWYLRAPSGEVRSAINALGAWDITTGNPNVVVAVLDSGVRFDHVDLKRVSEGGNLLEGYDFITNPFIANDGSGRDSDASDAGDGVTDADLIDTRKPNDCGSADIGDSSWHGTKVSGLIAALSNNGVGMASVGRTVRVLPVRVLGRCGGFDSDIIAGMRWAAGLNVPGVVDNPQPNRAKVINMSLGGTGSCTAYNDVVRDINAQGAVVVASAGNSAGQAVSVPAKCEGVIGVGGLRHIGTKVGFSDLGPEIAISAPAGNCVNVAPGDACLYPILSASNSGATSPVLGAAGSIYTDAFKPTVGTSFSAPLVAGTAALMLSVNPTLSACTVRNVIRASARPFPTTGSSAGVLQCNSTTSSNGEECYCNTATCGAGMLDAAAAVALASNPPAEFSSCAVTPNATPDPTPTPTPPTTTPPPAESGGGGGATTSLYWLLGIALAAAALRVSERRKL
ncbi:MAG: S8 family serine peptidase [Rhizobacter sp.]